MVCLRHMHQELRKEPAREQARPPLLAFAKSDAAPPDTVPVRRRIYLPRSCVVGEVRP